MSVERGNRVSTRILVREDERETNNAQYIKDLSSKKSKSESVASGDHRAYSCFRPPRPGRGLPAKPAGNGNEDGDGDGDEDKCRSDRGYVSVELVSRDS